MTIIVRIGAISLVALGLAACVTTQEMPLAENVVRIDTQAKGLLFVPYLNITLEHQFGSGTQTLTLAELGGPVGQTSFPAFDARNYGKLEGGLTIELAPEASISVTGATTFGREDGNDYRISTGLNYRF